MSMRKTIALVGRPNVGKSTLFNRITKTRDALVADVPGLTRDRQYGEAEFAGQRFIVIDTGGIAYSHGGIDALMLQQSEQAMLEADVLLWLVDARAGLMPDDEKLAGELRKLAKPIFLVVNKVDGLDTDVAIADFFKLGIEKIFPIAASHGRGVTQLLQQLATDFPADTIEEDQKDRGIEIALIGRPNVGKSTLTNRILGEDRVVVFDQPGTTRDSIALPFERQGKSYTLIDTAGIRRRSKTKATIEKFSVIKSLQSIETANVVVLVIDAQTGINEQDLRLLQFILDAGRALVIAVNKSDGLNREMKQKVSDELQRRLTFIDFARIHFISALKGSGIVSLFKSINEAYHSATKTLATAQLTDILIKATQQNPPPLVQGRRIKLRYAHAGGRNPPIIVIHGKQTQKLSKSYQRFLIKQFRTQCRLMGTPIKLQLKQDENPYEGRVNVLTLTQQRKRKRLMRHVKK